MKGRLSFCTLIILLFSFIGTSFSQVDGVVPVEIYLSHQGIPAGEDATLAVVFRVPPEQHITSLENELFCVKVFSPEGFNFSPPRFPDPVNFEGDDVFQGEVIVLVDFQTSADLDPGDYQVRVSYGYQVCLETGSQMCFLPQNDEQIFTIPVLESGVTPLLANQDIFGERARLIGEDISATKTLESRVASALEAGSLLAFILVFIAGILTSFMPCVYPVIPITIGYIGGSAGGKKLRGFLLSIFLVLGIALVYSTLGIIAAVTGSVFGSFTQHPLVLMIIAVIFGAMGASMLGAFEIQLPASLQVKMRTERRGFVGAFLVGMITGLVAAPCVGPVLVAILAWVAQTGNIILGFFLLFTFALGLGILFIVIGTFAGVLTALPGAGQWMDTVKHFFGYILIGAAIFIIKPILEQGYYFLLWGIFLTLTGVFMGALEILSVDAGKGRRWSKAVGVMVLLFGIVMFVDGYNHTIGFKKYETAFVPIGGSADYPEWIVNDVEEAFALAESSGRGVIMDFYADWCVACVELDERTWVDAKFIEESKDWVLLKIDLTRMNPELSALQRRYAIRGMPTVIFFDSQGKELHRFSGFRPADEVIGMMESLL